MLQKLRDKGGPTGLVTCTHARTVVAVKILVEGNQIAPIRVGLKLLDWTKDRAAFILIAQEDPGKASRDLAGDFPERQHLPRTDRTFDFEIFAEIVMKLLQRFDDQVVEREPDWTTPV